MEKIIFLFVSRKLGFSKGTRLLAFGNSLFSVEARVQGLTLLFHPVTQGVLLSVRSVQLADQDFQSNKDGSLKQV